MQQSFENVKLSATSFEGRQMVESFDMKEERFKNSFKKFFDCACTANKIKISDASF